MIYLDHNATTPPIPEVVSSMVLTYSRLWANVSSQHGPGQEAKRALSDARAKVAQVLGCKSTEVIFTSGATEANNLAVRGLLEAASAGRKRVVFSSVEHASHLRLARVLAANGFQVDLIPVLTDGSLDMTAASALIGSDVAVVSMMAANNETGVLMPVAEVLALSRTVGARLHVDATQLIGKLPFRFFTWGVDAVSFSGHKLHGPKGVGALLLRQGVALSPQIPGNQERGRRGGTENLPAIVGLSVALEHLGDITEDARRVESLRDALEIGLVQSLPCTHIWGRHVPRLPGTSYLRFGKLSADVVLQRLDNLGVAASGGAACSSTGSEPSHVLTAMGVPVDEALAAVRLSLGRTSTPADVQYLLNNLPPLLAPLLQEELTATSLT